MLKENKREEITKNIEKREALVEQVADGIWRIGVELPQNPLRELNSYLIKGKENERDLLIDTGRRCLPGFGHLEVARIGWIFF